MTEKEKATVDNLPAPTGQNQPLVTKPISIISQATENYNGKISQNGIFRHLSKGALIFEYS